MTEQMFTGHVILNWKNGNFRAVKRLPRRLKEVEIPIKINLKVKLPEPTPEMEVNGELELSATKVKELIFDSLESGDMKHE